MFSEQCTAGSSAPAGPLIPRLLGRGFATLMGAATRKPLMTDDLGHGADCSAGNCRREEGTHWREASSAGGGDQLVRDDHLLTAPSSFASVGANDSADSQEVHACRVAGKMTLQPCRRCSNERGERRRTRVRERQLN